MITKADYTQLDNGTLYLTNAPKIDYIDYWGHDKGKSTFDEQKINNDRIKGNYDRTKTDVAFQHVKGKSMLEIAPVPGCLLKRAVDNGMRAVGVLAEHMYKERLEQETGAEIITGFFGEVKIKDKFDTIVALDVFEHIEDGQKFIDDCKKLLNKGGRIVLMLPIIGYDDQFDDKNFNAEHIWIYSKQHLQEWLKPVAWDRWKVGHEVIVIDKISN